MGKKELRVWWVALIGAIGLILATAWNTVRQLDLGNLLLVGASLVILLTMSWVVGELLALRRRKR